MKKNKSQLAQPMEVQHELHAFVQDAQASMQRDFARITTRSREDPNTAGAQGESVWKVFFENWLPPMFAVRTGCRLIGHGGQTSKQVDVVILRPEYPKHLAEERYIMADGALAAFECKLKLRKANVPEFFDRSTTVKDTVDKRLGDPYSELQKPLLYGLLAQSCVHETKRSTFEAIEERIVEQDDLKVKHPANMPDVICVADLATWSAMKLTYPPGHPLGNKNGRDCEVQSAYFRNEMKAGSTSPLGALISSIWIKLSHEYPTLAPMANYFREAGIQGPSRGFFRKWPQGVLSERVLQRINEGGLNNSLGNRWSMWTSM